MENQKPASKPNVVSYRLARETWMRESNQHRELCLTCLQPTFGCYCAHVSPFDPKIQFVILIHPIEARRRIATGRMSHLCLENSELIQGQDFTNDARVNALLSDPLASCRVLYPGLNSQDISLPRPAGGSFFQTGLRPVVFVIDGTWATARKTMYQSANLKKLPRLSFSADRLSQFRVRKQPQPGCFSTIEAIHFALEHLGPEVGFPATSREHDKLLYVFDKMVSRQLEFVRQAQLNPELTNYRRPKTRFLY